MNTGLVLLAILIGSVVLFWLTDKWVDWMTERTLRKMIKMVRESS